MQSMSEDDAAYSALLAQLLSDSPQNRNARVHSWIEHQYDFALSEHSDSAQFPFASSRPPSPSLSSSLGAHRAYSIDRPDSPILNRASSPCPSYDALFFPQPDHASHADDPDFEEQERLRALRFIVQQMVLSKPHSAPPSPGSRDKTLPAPPPSPASSLTQSISSRAMRSRSSSTRISRLPSFTSTLSSDQSQPQEIPPPLPVSVVVHGEYQHDVVLRHDRPIVDGYLHRRDDSYPHVRDLDAQLLFPTPDDKDSVQPSPTFSNFSCAYSRETSFTTPCASSPTSPASVVFSSSPCAPEDIALPTSPVDERPFIHDRTPSDQTSEAYLPLSHTQVLPMTNVFPASPTSPSFERLHSDANEPSRHLCAPYQAQHSESRWSVATTASLTPSTAEPKPGVLLSPRSALEKRDKSIKTPKKRARFMSIISRFSPSRTDMSSISTGTIADDAEYDSANDSDVEDKEKRKRRKSLSKKSSLASLRASFSLSRASFSSQRPPAIEEIPPLPTSPTLGLPFVENIVPTDVPPLLPTAPLSRIPSRANLMNSRLPPIPQSASTITTFQTSSQLSISDVSVMSASESRGSLPLLANPNASRISLLPSPSNRTSQASAASLEPEASITRSNARSKSIFRLTAKPKSLKVPTTPVTKPTPSRLPTSRSSPATVRSKIPQAPTKFTPPAKLANVIATQSRPVTVVVSTRSSSPTSKLPVSPTRPPPKIPRIITALEKPLMASPPSLSPSSRLPMPASTKGVRVGTVKGFWKRP